MERVRREGRVLLRGGQPWSFVLVNAYYLQDEVGQGTPAHAAEALDGAVHLGVPVVRTWAFNDNPRKASRMQVDLGVSHEPGLLALDWVVAEAGRRGLQLILTLMDYWPAYGGMAQWLAWRGRPVAAADRDHPARYAADFYADGQLREAYRQRVTALLDRRNTLTGRRYGEDDTVLAWELMNEARQAPADWVDFAAGVVRAGARQLVALGDEAAYDGEALDLASLHLYPEKHGAAVGSELMFGQEAILAAARRVTRPLLVGEFGLRGDRLSLPERQASYTAWFAAAEAAGVAGIGPWLLGHSSRPPAWDEHFTFYIGGAYDSLLRRAAERTKDQA